MALRTARSFHSGMSTLLVGFDSAWTARRSGAIAGVARSADGSIRELGHPNVANFPEAAEQITAWQAQHDAATTVVMLDQPTIVTAATGQRPVEHIVSSPVGRRRGGVQPSSTSRTDMFGADAPLWPFVRRFGAECDPRGPVAATSVFETYPVLTMIALGWLRADRRPAGRLPKYNPERRSTFSLDDWQFVCGKLAEEFRRRSMPSLLAWTNEAASKAKPRKVDQDKLDACICLLAALHVGEGRDCLMVGDTGTGFVVVPYGDRLHRELEERCLVIGRRPDEFVHAFRRSV